MAFLNTCFELLSFTQRGSLFQSFAAVSEKALTPKCFLFVFWSAIVPVITYSDTVVPVITNIDEGASMITHNDEGR